MNKLAIVFVAVCVAVVAAAPNNLLSNLKTLKHIKRAVTLLKPLQAVSEQKKGYSNSELEELVALVDMDHDGMLNAAELRVVLSAGGVSPSELDMYVTASMVLFDHDGNHKLDIEEVQAMLKLAEM